MNEVKDAKDDEIDGLLEQLDAGDGGSISDDQLSELLGEEPAVDPNAGMLEKLNVLMRGLDYTGGFTRSKLAQLAGLVKQEEIDDALKLRGDFPSSDIILGRAGVPDGKARTAAGFVGDMLIDPSFAAGIAAKFARQGWNLANVIRHIGRPVGSGLATAGEGIFKAGFKEMDLAARAAGKSEKAVSDVAWKYKDKIGSWNPKTIRMSDRYNALMDDLRSHRDAIEAAAAKGGAKFDPSKNLSDTIGYINEMKKDPATAGTAEELSKLLQEYISKGPTDIGTARQWKSNAQSLAKSQYTNPVSPNIPAARAHEIRASEMRRGIVDSIDSVLPGSGAKYDDLNDELGALLTGSRSMESNVGKAVRANNITPVDVMYGALGSGQLGPKGTIAGVAAKKIADNLKYPGPRAAAGYLMDQYGRSAIVLPAMKRLAIESDRSDQNPWDYLWTHNSSQK